MSLVAFSTPSQTRLAHHIEFVCNIVFPAQVVLVGVFAFVHYQSTMDQSAEMDGAPAKEMVPMKADDDEAPEESLAVSGGV